MEKPIKKIAILTGGGDCPGLNAVIRAATKQLLICTTLMLSDTNSDTGACTKMIS